MRSSMLSGVVLLGLGVMEMTPAFAADQAPPPRELTAEQDHQLMMEQLGIKEIRQGADGRDANAPNAANYDEAKGNPYPDLPEALKFDDGKPVKNARDWKRRRAQIVEHFDREVYGRVPKHVPGVAWKVAESRDDVVGGRPVLFRKLIGHVDNSAYPLIDVDIQAELTTPRDAKHVPVIVEFFPFEFRGRFPAPPSPTWQEQVVAKGWAYAVLSTSTIQADNGAGLTKGIIGLVNKGQPRRAEDWGALRAWAWGASRLLDHLEKVPEVDAKRAVIEGVSRFGKASLVTMAYEPRYAIGFIGSSGMGGAALHRRRIGELLENVAGSGEYHWMAGNYIKYAGPLTAKDLPVDAHELIALSAPRPLFIGAGNPAQGDAWVDPRGMFMATVAASPVYRLLGKRALDTTEFPPIETALTAGELAYRQHAGGHTSGPNWPTFLEFASRYFEKK
ncbi:MAG TPA: hypothetical protein VM146_19365 [Steroidobacteraceae bacterium]|nr:hypothetical protein [Steroidobacteraceae bacterium]